VSVELEASLGLRAEEELPDAKIKGESQMKKP